MSSIKRIENLTKFVAVKQLANCCSGGFRLTFSKGQRHVVGLTCRGDDIVIYIMSVSIPPGFSITSIETLVGRGMGNK